jgi:hypothetical protein
MCEECIEAFPAATANLDLTQGQEVAIETALDEFGDCEDFAEEDVAAFTFGVRKNSEW